MESKKFTTIEAYIKSLPSSIKEGFIEFHNIINAAAPDTEKGIGYGMPCLRLKGVLLYYASHTNHYSLYPSPSAIEAFKDQLVKHTISKGTIQFEHGRPLPKKLISSIVKYRLKEKLAQNELKKKK